MKILIINSVCGIKSTGRICTDLATVLSQDGHEVKIAYGREKVPEKYVSIAVKIGNSFTNVIHGIGARLFDADGRGSILATLKFIRWVKKFDPDVIHIHNLHGYYINIRILFNYIIKYKKKVIWTLHDMWAFTGHSCTCDLYKCEKWKERCSDCPAKNEYPKTYFDFSKSNYLRKKQLISNIQDLTIVTPSKWLSGLVTSSFLSKFNIEVIPNGVDTSVFKPLPNDFKNQHNIESKTLLMGCSTWWEESKGLYDFHRLAAGLNDNFRIVLVGLTKQQIRELPPGIIGLEKTNSTKELAYIYSAADVFLNLTYRDNYPTVNIEALSCGTPVVTYDTGGSGECLKDHNGKLFKQGDIDGIIKFFNQEYTPSSFVVDDTDSHSKLISIQEYEKEYSDRGGYFEVKRTKGLNGKIVILGVASPWSDRKGLKDFVYLSTQLNPKRYKIIMIGVSEEQKRALPEEIIGILRTDSPTELAMFYSISDIYINLTYQDNYPTTNLEAIACGTPVVTYNTGGSPESTDKNSVVDVGDLEGIIKLLKDNAVKGSEIDISKETMLKKYRIMYTKMSGAENG